MAESQSRYSIVERLTNTKLEFIDSRSQIDESLSKQELELQSLVTDLETYEKQAQEDIAREVKRKEKEIKEVKNILTFKTSQKETKLAAIDTKIEQVNKALKAIEKISETAPTPKQQASK